MTYATKMVMLSVVSCLMLGACGKNRSKKAAEAPSPAAEVETDTADEPQADNAVPATEEEVVSLFEACKEAGKDAAVSSIQETVALLNLLPKPVSIPCFIAALPRNYALTAAESPASAQPATREEPRFFLSSGALIITVTGSGAGKEHVELSEFDGSRFSIKGDLTFPIADELEATTPFAMKTEGKDSPCAACHGLEKGGPKDARDATSSEALRPSDEAILTADEVGAIKAACESELSASCQLVRAIFFDAKPGAFAFPKSMKVLNGKPGQDAQE